MGGTLCNRPPAACGACRWGSAGSWGRWCKGARQGSDIQVVHLAVSVLGASERNSNNNHVLTGFTCERFSTVDQYID